MGAKEDAQNALFAAVTAELPKLQEITSTANRATALQTLSNAYRLAAGGPQAGSVVVEK